MAPARWPRAGGWSDPGVMRPGPPFAELGLSIAVSFCQVLLSLLSYRSTRSPSPGPGPGPRASPGWGPGASAWGRAARPPQCAFGLDQPGPVNPPGHNGSGNLSLCQLCPGA
eukprot:633469-Hanusia_phi.AAC.1